MWTIELGLGEEENLADYAEDVETNNKPPEISPSYMRCHRSCNDWALNNVSWKEVQKATDQSRELYKTELLTTMREPK